LKKHKCEFKQNWSIEMIDTKKVAANYRLAHWAGVVRERAESGLTVKAFCASAGIHPNSYFYWQRKLRGCACEEMTEGALSVPSGWALATQSGPVPADSRTVPIEIGKCRVIAGMDTDEALLAKVCGVLAGL
jgi:hypothetical protein